MINKVILIGRCGKDPEVRTTPNGKQVANFTLATSEKYNDKEVTEWHKIVSWSKSADKIRKGDKLYIEGKIQTRSWDDQSGQKRYTTEIVSNIFLWMNPRQDTPANHGGFPEPVYTQPGSQQQQYKNEQEDLPF